MTLLGILALGAVLRAPTFGRALLSDDEAIYATTADALRRGDRLYRDVVDHKPPLIYHVYEAGFAALGPYATHGAHALVVLAALVVAGLLFAIQLPSEPSDGFRTSRDGLGRAQLDRARRESAEIGLAAAALWVIFSTTWHDYDALAANCELFLLVPQTLAAWLLLRALRRTPAGARDLGVHLGVGALIGTSALFKYQGFTFLGASAGLVVWWAILGRRSWSWAATRALCHLVGALLPPALYLLGCLGAGNAAATVFWFAFNFSYVQAGLTGMAALARGARRLGLIGGIALVPYGLGASAAVVAAADMLRVLGDRRRGAARSEASPPPPSAVLGVLWLATSIVALAAGGRFFGHYFHLVLAPLCLLAAPAVRRLWHRGWSTRGPLLALSALPALLFFWLATFGRPTAAALDGSDPPYEEVAARIDALTAPDERVFVWGNSPQLYILARRPMGARFSFCNYMTGESPGTPTETGARNADANQLPLSWDMLFEDLERRRPTLLVDAAAAGWDGYGKYPIGRYPRLRAYVDRHYQPVDVVGGVVLYRRRP